MGLMPLDMHAHVDTAISPASLRELNAVVFVATKSPTDAEAGIRRHDEYTVWGVGTHPGLVRVQKAFDASTFAALVGRTPYVGEIGLDGKSRVDMQHQSETFDSVLRILDAYPRVASIHSYRATAEVLDVLGGHHRRGLILHWWLGTPAQTRAAVDLGCYFSINPSSARRTDVLRDIPPSRVLTETDHPAGDRFSRNPRPGQVIEVERVLARHYGVSADLMREQIWRNLDAMITDCEIQQMLPRKIRVQLATL